MSKHSSSELRRHLRIGLEVEIELTLPGQEPRVFSSKNISEGGLYLIMEGMALPSIGTEVKVRLRNQLGDGEEPPINRAVVVRQDSDGIGLVFIE